MAFFNNIAIQIQIIDILNKHIIFFLFNTSSLEIVNSN